MLLPAEVNQISDEQPLARQTWEQCLSLIKDQISSLSYKTWFQPIVPLRLSGTDLTVQVPSQFFAAFSQE